MQIFDSKIILLSLSLTFNLFANLDYAPPSFEYADGKAVFIDIIRNHNEQTYDVKNKKITIKSWLRFSMQEEGYPLFDLSAERRAALQINRDSVKIRNNSEPKAKFEMVELAQTSLPETSKGSQTKIRVINKKLKPGLYTFRMSYSLENFKPRSDVKGDHIPTFENKKVDDFVFLTDFNSRNFIEQRFPSNLEYDQYKMTLKIKFKGTFRKHVALTNGKAKYNKIGNSISVSYPDYFTANSFFYHLTESENILVEKFKTKEEGIEVTLYADTQLEEKEEKIKFLKSKTIETMSALNEDFGKWPHRDLVIYASSNPLRSMEYSGATVLGLGDEDHGEDGGLTHELVHSYFGRSVLPSSGEASWLDEAITTLYDAKRTGAYYYQSYIQPLVRSGNIRATMEEGDYQRYTNQESYIEGAGIIGHLIYQIDNDISLPHLNPFLTYLYQSSKNKVLSSEDLLNTFKGYYSIIERNPTKLNKYVEEFFQDTVF